MNSLFPEKRQRLDSVSFFIIESFLQFSSTSAQDHGSPHHFLSHYNSSVLRAAQRLPRPRRSFQQSKASALDVSAHEAEATDTDASFDMDPDLHSSSTSKVLPNAASPSCAGSANTDDTSEPNIGYYSPSIFKTEVDELGLYKVYAFGKPSVDPSQNARFNTFVQAPTFNSEGRRDGSRATGDLLGPKDSTSSSTNAGHTWGPFSNPSEFLVTDWAYHYDTTSFAAMNDLVQNVMLNSQFNPEHLQSYDAKRASEKLDRWLDDPVVPDPSVKAEGVPFAATAPDKWLKGKVRIPMPHKDSVFISEEAAPHLEIDNICHRKLTEVIRSAFEDSSFSEFDIKPFKRFWKPSENEPVQRVYGETYSSTRALDIEQDLYYGTLENPLFDSTHEPVIAWLQLWSDSTHLADFGTASLWPIYLYFGNLSKYIRGKSSSHAAHHLAYIPSVSVYFPLLTDSVLNPGLAS